MEFAPFSKVFNKYDVKRDHYRTGYLFNNYSRIMAENVSHFQPGKTTPITIRNSYRFRAFIFVITVLRSSIDDNASRGNVDRFQFVHDSQFLKIFVPTN